jgi:hypothetical protein
LLARRALPFLASMEQRDTLPERRTEYGLFFVGFDLYADRLKAHFVFRHGRFFNPLERVTS